MRARGALLGALLAALACAAAAPAPAAAEFGLGRFEADFSEISIDEEGAPQRTPSVQAGSHPFAVESFAELNYHDSEGEPVPDGHYVRDLILEQVRGLTGDTTAVARCSTLQFATDDGGVPSCANETAVGVTAVIADDPLASFPIAAPIYNLTPPPGVPVRLGFVYAGIPTVIDVAIKPSPDYNAVASVTNIVQTKVVFGAATELWGVPADPAHDFLRGFCALTAFPGKPLILDGKLNYRKGGVSDEFVEENCSAEVPEPQIKPWLTLPRACAGPLASSYEMRSWAPFDPPSGQLLAPFTASGFELSDAFEGCGPDKVPFDPEISSEATTDSAASASGQNFELEFEDEVDHIEGLTEPDGIAASDMKKIVVTLPAGMTANPSLAEGLGVCTPADLERETLAASPGQGCPNAAKIGTVSVQTPLVDEEVKGDVYIASPDDPATAAPGAENPFDSLLAFYIVLKNPNLGILVKVPAKVEPDPLTGQLVTTVDDSPQIPFSRFNFHFREGVRAPLITPAACGAYTTTAELTPWARPNEVIERTASFQITRGVNGGPCPPGGVRPFGPGFQAGSINNSAGAYSPFYMRLTRSDGEQDMTRFSAVLPPGVVGKIAGLSKCPEAQIAAAKAKTGLAERANPSCPATSQVGRTLAGAGVGSALTYVPGSLYLAGPVGGDPLSVVSITPAVAGPFDAGTVVVREALTLNPETAEVEVDGAASDPIPHILKGIPLNVRDLRVYVDKPDFTLNPTDCKPSSARATLFGSYLNVFDPADDVPVGLAARYQAADCASLGFKPRLQIKLKGGTKRGSHPALKAIVTPRPGDANFARAVVTLPRSAFLDQAHIRTICTRVQFAAGAGNGAECPPGAVYGKATAWSPLLEEPLSGPVYLRSSNNNLPDLVVALHGLVNINLASRIDSQKGGIRSSFESIPDAPVSRFVLEMQGGKKGLIVNSTNLCAGRHRAKARLSGQNGKVDKIKPLVRASGCKKKAKKKHRRHGR